MDIKKLLNNIVSWPDDHDIEITGLSFDSRLTQVGDLFLAHATSIELHEQYIAQAIKKGAVAILRETQPSLETFTIRVVQDRSIPILCVDALASKAGIIAARFYENPSDSLLLIGVTGTNGKTSCCQFIAEILEKTHRRCGIIGTLGTGFPHKITPGSLTTPDAITLQKTLSTLQQAGARYIAMEASSHSLVQRRTAGIQFDIGIFTNLTQDHLDYHGNMENYAQAKRLLFAEYPLKYAVINADDPFGQKLLSEYASQFPCYAYTLSDTKTNVPTISAHRIKLTAHGISAYIETPWGEGQIKTSLLGRFNLSNLLAAIATLSIIGCPLPQILTQISSLTTVPGRMQAIGGGKLPLVVIDYAHTPDALEKALTSLREHTHGKLWCVFGCGGNRDADKRHLMGEIAERYSDQIIITDDNPRFENPDKIIDDITQGLLCPWAAEVEQDRQTAIAHAIDCAEAGDVILIAGKGHETYQQIMDEKIPFNDLEQARENTV
ncbi:MAG: UDP-N-acetylmuramyl peptide synthase [Gammaproteobacteria bacterium]|nr:UDP-N-acetylmuramyl peptide synthase [Gammaproteobacteria bacterium]